MNQKGFSLIELLIGLVILSIGLMAIAGMQITSVRSNYFSKNLTQATYIAQDRMEFIERLPFDSNQLLAGNYNDGTATYAGQVFNRSYTVGVNGDLKTINYSVTWNDGVNHNVSFSTIRVQ